MRIGFHIFNIFLLPGLFILYQHFDQFLGQKFISLKECFLEIFCHFGSFSVQLNWVLEVILEVFLLVLVFWFDLGHQTLQQIFVSFSYFWCVQSWIHLTLVQILYLFSDFVVGDDKILGVIEIIYFQRWPMQNIQTLPQIFIQIFVWVLKVSRIAGLYELISDFSDFLHGVVPSWYHQFLIMNLRHIISVLFHSFFNQIWKQSIKHLLLHNSAPVLQGCFFHIFLYYFECSIIIKCFESPGHQNEAIILWNKLLIWLRQLLLLKSSLPFVEIPAWSQIRYPCECLLIASVQSPLQYRMIEKCLEHISPHIFIFAICQKFNFIFPVAWSLSEPF